ncbi:MAG: bifunctional diaminohydroxyphosphoribosylaminopyrimidine deaminase/5-amino-6-(5-phosphoribosylamino)uracil reductase RibD [Thermaerobacterales bacterium]
MGDRPWIANDNTGAVSDARWMRRALALAARGRGRTHPNPMVGCVIVKNGAVIGEGFHPRAGESHAEIRAILDAGGEPAVQGATVYVTLEPCCHHGRTPPCTDALLRSHPARVVIAMADPFPAVAGGGIALLRQAGITTEVGLLEQEARLLNEAWLLYVRKHRPFVAIKFAMTLDGKIAAADGSSFWITETAARERAHRLRDHYDAVLVGVGTVLTDNPRLTCRIAGGRDPLRVILDSRARTPPDARVLADRSVLIAVSADAPAERCQLLAAAGGRIVTLAQDDGGISLSPLLQRLKERGITSLLVEGGAAVHASFLHAGLVDKIYSFIAPKFLGGPSAPGPTGDLGITNIRQALSYQFDHAETVGHDVLLIAYPVNC